jgi:hypothetical protein
MSESGRLASKAGIQSEAVIAKNPSTIRILGI